MARRLLKKGSGVRFSLIVIVVSALVTTGGLGVAAYLKAQSDSRLAAFATELRDGLVKSCEDNGNPLRATVRSLLRERIRSAESPLVRELFPDIPDYLLEAQIAADQARLRDLRRVDCAAQYPRP